MTETPAACEVWFYHLEQSPVEEVLPDLLEKTLARGWRALVVSPDERRIERLDEQLWTERPSSFLPHGKADDGGAENQPVSTRRPRRGSRVPRTRDTECGTLPSKQTTRPNGAGSTRSIIESASRPREPSKPRQ